MQVDNKQEEIAFNDRLNELRQAVAAGNLVKAHQCLKVKGFSENALMCTSVFNTLLNLPYKDIVENHFLIMQMVLSLHPQLDRDLVGAVCEWLITMKNEGSGNSRKLTLYFGQNILTLLSQCGHISESVLVDCQSIADIRINERLLVQSQAMTTEMITAILTNNVEAFEEAYNKMNIDYDIYQKILLKCLQIQDKAYGIISWLLVEQPLSIQNPDNVLRCIGLLQEHLFAPNQLGRQDQLNAAKISLLQYIALSYALAENRGRLRSHLTRTVEQLLLGAGIAVADTKNVQNLIFRLSCAIDPALEQQMAAISPQHEQYTALDVGIFALTLFYNVLRLQGGIERRNFIDHDIELGMIPGCKCGLSIISEFKKINNPLALVVTCTKKHEREYENLFYTPANPAFWRNQPGNIKQIFVPLGDFGYKTDPAIVCNAVNEIHEVIKQKRGGVYIHCKAGKARSVLVLVLYYVLFREDLWQSTLMDTIKFHYDRVQAIRPQINNNAKCWNALHDYVLMYMQSEFKHADVGVYLKESVESALLEHQDAETIVMSSL